MQIFRLKMYSELSKYLGSIKRKSSKTVYEKSRSRN